MRRLDKRADEGCAWELFRRAPFVHLASTSPDGAPLLRPLHAVVVDDALCFHGAPAGEKLDVVGRAAVVMAQEVVAEIPSTFSHPERACPATTLYRSASAHGPVTRVDDPAGKARVLQALMERFQPEGGHRPITHDDPMYRAAVAGIAIFAIRPERVEAKHALGQMKRPEERRRWVEALWARGAAGDARAAQAILDAAETPTPLVEGPHGTRLLLAADERHVEGAVALLSSQAWNVGLDSGRLRAAQLGSPVWMVLTHGAEVVATARALTDRAKTSYVADVAVHEATRGRGLGRFLLGRLADHPDLRRTRIDLLTRDAGPFYEGMGYVPMSRSQPWRLAR